MKNFILALLLLNVSVAWAINPPEVAPDFSLKNQDGKVVSLKDFKNKIVVLEWFNYGCPYVKKHYESKNMQTSQATYKANDNVVWLTIVSSAKGKQGHFETYAEAKAKMQELDLKADHLLLDEDGSVGQLYEAKTTPHMYVVDFDGKLGYVGAIDSVASSDPEDIKGATNYVVSAVSKLLLKEKPNPAKTRPYGCGVKY